MFIIAKNVKKLLPILIRLNRSVCPFVNNLKYNLFNLAPKQLFIANYTFKNHSLTKQSQADKLNRGTKSEKASLKQYEKIFQTVKDNKEKFKLYQFQSIEIE